MASDRESQPASAGRLTHLDLDKLVDTPLDKLVDTPIETPPDSAVYQHVNKPAWGIAVIAWERDDKRGYMFESRELRVIKDGYYHLMLEVDVSADRAAALFAAARTATTKAATVQTASRKTSRRHISVEEQFDYFLREFPGGFAGDKWKTEHRAGPGRTLKRHRDAAIVSSAEALSEARLTDGLAGDATAALAAVAKVLSATDLVPTAKARRFAEIRAESASAVVAALRDVLWSEPTEGQPLFNHWVAAVAAATGESPSWTLATALPALARPEECVCVRKTAFAAQALSLAPRLQLGDRPSQLLYQRALAMAVRVTERARARDIAPTDLLDVHDFIRFSLSPRARAAILARRG